MKVHLHIDEDGDYCVVILNGIESFSVIVDEDEDTDAHENSVEVGQELARVLECDFEDFT